MVKSGQTCFSPSSGTRLYTCRQVSGIKFELNILLDTMGTVHELGARGQGSRGERNAAHWSNKYHQVWVGHQIHMLQTLVALADVELEAS
jgi:hypothetical protein